MSTGLPKERVEQADRMRRLREAMGYESQTAFAQFLGVTVTRWNNVEQGYKVSSSLVDILVRKIPGVDAGWIMHGYPGGLSLEWARRLGELEAKDTTRAS